MAAAGLFRMRHVSNDVRCVKANERSTSTSARTRMMIQVRARINAEC